MGYDMYTVVGEEYFCTNIWGMDSLRNLMGHADVLGWEGEGTKWPNSDKAKEVDWDENHPNVIEHEKACDVVRKAQCEDRGKVPGHKFCSNDGWIVTPRECLLIAAGVEKFLEENTDYGSEDDWDARAFYTKWAAYNRNAAKDGGYKVW